jgi:hypothetical protein
MSNSLLAVTAASTSGKGRLSLPIASKTIVFFNLTSDSGSAFLTKTAEPV